MMPKREEDKARGKPYKAPIHLEQQKFGPSEEVRLSVWGAGSIEGERKVWGLKQTKPEARALAALQIIATTRDFVEIHGEGTTVHYELPFTQAEYFEAYGLELVDGRYPGGEREKALEGLNGLTRATNMGCEHKCYVGEGDDRVLVSRNHVTTEPLVVLNWRWEVRESQVRDGKAITSRATMMSARFGDFLMFRRDTFYTLKSPTLYRDIAAASPEGPKPMCVSIFIDYLEVGEWETIKIGREKLATKLRLDAHIRQRKPALLEEALQLCFSVAIELGYLLSRREENGVFEFTLDPEHCLRVKRKKERKSIGGGDAPHPRHLPADK